MSSTTRCAPTTAIECLTSSVRRILWDGDRELAEISAPRDTANSGVEELDSNFPFLQSITLGARQYGDPNTHFCLGKKGGAAAIERVRLIERILKLQNK